jgi:hypothetical protein
MKKLTYPAFEELEKLRAKVAHRREYLELLEMELFNTRESLQEFTQAYNEHLGGYESELSRLEALLEASFEEEEKARAKLKGGKKGGWRFSGGHHTQSDEENDRKSEAEKDPAFEKKIRELFRKLAKRFHPDLASEMEDKSEREKIMAKINQAYTARDMKSLESFAKQMKEGQSERTLGPEAAILRHKVELRQLESMIFEVEHTIREIDLSRAMQLRSELHFEKESGRDLFADVESGLKERIAELRDHLFDLGLDEDLLVEKK